MRIKLTFWTYDATVVSVASRVTRDEDTWTYLEAIYMLDREA